MPQEMQAYSGLQKRINELLSSDSSPTQTSIIIKELEKEAFNICLSFDMKIQSLHNELNVKNNGHKKLARHENSKFRASLRIL